MADTLDDVNANIAAEKAELGDLGSALSKLEADAATVLQLLKSGQPVQDFTPQVEALQANLAILSGAVNRVTSDDATVLAAEPVQVAPSGGASVSANQPPASVASGQ